MKIAFITSIFGDLEDRPASFKTIEGFDYYLFTDRPKPNIKEGWNVHNISENKNISTLTCNIRKSRYAKFMGWELLQTLGKSYDYLYYCDAFYTPNSDANWIETSKHVMSEKFPFHQDSHENPRVRRYGMLVEFTNILQYQRDSHDNIVKTIDFIQNNYPDVNICTPRYFQNTMFGYDPNSEIVQSITKEFWELYTSNDITYRDQPLWNLLLLKNNLIPTSSPELRHNFFQLTGKPGDHHHARDKNIRKSKKRRRR